MLILSHMITSPLLFLFLDQQLHGQHCVTSGSKVDTLYYICPLIHFTKDECIVVAMSDNSHYHSVVNN